MNVTTSEMIDQVSSILMPIWEEMKCPAGKEPATWLQTENTTKFIGGLAITQVWLIPINYAVFLSTEFYHEWCKKAFPMALDGKLPMPDSFRPIAEELKVVMGRAA